MKLFIIDYVYIFLAVFLLSILTVGFILDYDYKNRKQTEFVTEKEFPPCEAFTAVEINVSGDRYRIVFHTGYQEGIGYDWGDGSVYTAWDAEAREIIK